MATSNYPNKELLGRYDMYPDPRGKEDRAGEGQGGLPPPGNRHIYPQEGAIMPCLNKKTSASGVLSLGTQKTNKTKQKIRDLRRRWQQTGSLARPKVKSRPASVAHSGEISLSQAIEEYVNPRPRAEQANQTSQRPNTTSSGSSSRPQGHMRGIPSTSTKRLTCS